MSFIIHPDFKVFKDTLIIESDSVEINIVIKLLANPLETKDVVDATLRPMHHVGVFSFVNCNLAYNFAAHFLACIV